MSSNCEQCLDLDDIQILRNILTELKSNLYNWIDRKQDLDLLSGLDTQVGVGFSTIRSIRTTLSLDDPDLANEIERLYNLYSTE